GPCTITFGSSNNTAALRMFQADGGGASAMWRYGTEALDTTDPAGWPATGKVLTSMAGAQVIGGGLVQRDGKLIAVGSSAGQGLAIRYNTDGSLDTTFDDPLSNGTGDGIVTLAHASAWWVIDAVQQSDGKLVLAARAQSPAEDRMWTIRLNVNGTLDPSYGTGGYAWLTSGSPGIDMIDAVTIQADDKVVVAGCASPTEACWTDGTHAVFGRFTTNGQPDSTFSGDGGAYDDFPASGGAMTRPWASDVAVDDSGRILLGGEAGNQGFVARYTAAGAPDATFSAADNFLRIDVPGAGIDNGEVLSIAPDGKIYLSGANGAGIFAARIQAGTLDGTWGAGGIAIQAAAIANCAPETAVLRSDGVLMLGASGSGVSCPGGTDTRIAAFDPDGVPDSRFGGDGYHEVSNTAGAGLEGAAQILPFRDGRIAVMGHADTGGANSTDPSVFVFDDGGSITDYSNGPADWDSPSATSAFGACLSATTATNDWPVNAGCAQTDGVHWRAMPANTGAGTATAAHTTVATTLGATATFRFGIRPSDSQTPGKYWAEAIFEVVAPT
ncbi:MAG: cya, partial [Thermoleophilia bacterium]|nr:cya [Thermoleophilia bacterium]